MPPGRINGYYHILQRTSYSSQRVKPVGKDSTGNVPVRKKRKLHHYQLQIKYLKAAPIRVTIPKGQSYVVGAKDESFGNQTCQWDGQTIKIRVPYCLEDKFGKYVSSEIGDFRRRINRLPAQGAKTWHFYRKDGRWCVAVQFTPKPVKQVTRACSKESTNALRRQFAIESN